jgi:hypothetical protein
MRKLLIFPLFLCIVISVTAQTPIRNLQRVVQSSYPVGSTSSTLLNGLIAYWKLDATSGTTEVATVGTSANAALSGATSNATGIINKGVTFSNIGDFINVATLTNIQYSSSALSISLWFKLTALPHVTGRTYYLFDEVYATAPYNGISIIMNYGGTDDGLYFKVYDVSGANRYFYASDNQYVINTWYNLVVVLSGTGQNAKIYLNTVDKYVSNTGGTTTGVLPTINYLNFGNELVNSLNGIVGILDEIAIWNRGLTSTEVTTLYNSGAGKTHPFN